MSATRDNIGVSSIGIQSIAPTREKSWRDTKRKADDDPNNTDDAQNSSNYESASPSSPDNGRLVDKTA
jgi:hypothetical protein